MKITSFDIMARVLVPGSGEPLPEPSDVENLLRASKFPGFGVFFASTHPSASQRRIWLDMKACEILGLSAQGKRGGVYDWSEAFRSLERPEKLAREVMSVVTSQPSAQLLVQTVQGRLTHFRLQSVRSKSFANMGEFKSSKTAGYFMGLVEDATATAAALCTFDQKEKHNHKYAIPSAEVSSSKYCENACHLSLVPKDLSNETRSQQDLEKSTGTTCESTMPTMPPVSVGQAPTKSSTNLKSHPHHPPYDLGNHTKSRYLKRPDCCQYPEHHHLRRYAQAPQFEPHLRPHLHLHPTGNPHQARHGANNHQNHHFSIHLGRNHGYPEPDDRERSATEVDMPFSDPYYSLCEKSVTSTLTDRTVESLSHFPKRDGLARRQISETFHSHTHHPTLGERRDFIPFASASASASASAFPNIASHQPRNPLLENSNDQLQTCISTSRSQAYPSPYTAKSTPPSPPSIQLAPSFHKTAQRFVLDRGNAYLRGCDIRGWRKAGDMFVRKRRYHHSQSRVATRRDLVGSEVSMKEIKGMACMPIPAKVLRVQGLYQQERSDSHPSQTTQFLPNRRTY